MSKNKTKVKNLKVMHQIKDRDFLGYRINKNSILTVHHIIKKVYYEIDDISNYALLTMDAHVWLHSLESSDLHLYNEITAFFIETKAKKRRLDKDYYKDLEKVLRKER